MNHNYYRIYLFLFMILANHNLIGQELKIQKIDDLTEKSTSYYDILKGKNDTYYLCGKNGVLSKLKDDKAELLHQFPEHLYKIIQLNDSILFICGNHGTLYYYNLINHTYTTQHFKKLNYACIYEACQANDSTLYICGGASKIGLGKKTLPRGFIFKTTNSGKSWKKIYKRKTQFVWDIELIDSTQKLLTIAYAPWGTKVVEHQNNFKRRKTIFKTKSIIHQFANNNIGIFNGGNFKSNKGFISPNPICKTLDSKFCWSSIQLNDCILSCHSDGEMLLFSKRQSKSFKTNSNNNLYEIAQINEYQFYVVGSNNTIMKVSITNKNY